MTTPKTLIDVLDLITAPEIAAPQLLSVTTEKHFDRVRTIFDDDNIVGAGVARKISDGRASEQLSVVFYVKQKVPADALRPGQLLPPVLAAANGRAVFTDVIEIGEIVPQAPNVLATPLRSGFSVGHKDITAGTLGAVVRKGGKPHLLSNSHVLANAGLGKPGDEVIYPGPDDGGTLAASTVATLESFTPFFIGPSFTNTADAALALLLEDQFGHIDLDILGAATPRKIATPKRDMVVIKRGRTTGDTESIVRDVDFRILVGYPDVGTVGFTGQVRCDTYTKGGDSGSIVVDKATGAIVGLHFAGSASGSVFTPIRTVMKALGFKF